jgi:transaldolase
MSNERTQALHDLGQSLWVDNITRAMLRDGVLGGYIDDLSLTGLTSNPTIFDKAVSGGADYDTQIAESKASSTEETFFELAIADLSDAAELFAGVHKRTDGVDGFVSLEVSPLLADDADATTEQAAKLHAQAAHDNIFIKIPGTPAGLRSIEDTIYAGIPVNVTLLFSGDQYLAAADAYLKGIERRVAEGLDPDVASVASLFMSRWDAKVVDQTPAELRGKLGIAVGEAAYRSYCELLASGRMKRLQNEGARPQRLLWASTGTKDESLSDVLYVEGLASPLTVNTMPEKTLKAFADHGEVRQPLAPDGGDADEVLQAHREAGMEPAELAEQLQAEGKESFNDSWRELMSSISSEREKLGSAA